MHTLFICFIMLFAIWCLTRPRHRVPEKSPEVLQREWDRITLERKFCSKYPSDYEREQTRAADAYYQATGEWSGYNQVPAARLQELWDELEAKSRYEFS